MAVPYTHPPVYDAKPDCRYLRVAIDHGHVLTCQCGRLRLPQQPGLFAETAYALAVSCYKLTHPGAEPLSRDDLRRIDLWRTAE